MAPARAWPYIYGGLWRHEMFRVRQNNKKKKTTVYLQQVMLNMQRLESLASRCLLRLAFFSLQS